MNNIAPEAPPRKVIIGVDTHKHIHVAVAIDQNGARLGDLSVSADSGGYAQLEGWAQALGRVDRFGIEGTGSYGAGLSSYLRRCGHRIIEVNRGDRRTRRQNGKSDTLDAISAARATLAGDARGEPKGGTGTVEAMRVLLVAKRSARAERVRALNQMRHLIYVAPDAIRARFVAGDCADESDAAAVAEGEAKL